MIEALEKRVVARASFKGHLDTYRFCDNVRIKAPPSLCLAQAIRFWAFRLV